MSARKSHTKSRNGCKRCKMRKIKCDEVHPSCGNCIKHDVCCDFAMAENATLSELEDSSPPAGSSSLRTGSASRVSKRGHPRQSRSSSIPSRVSEGLEMQDLELMHHWTQYTHLTLATNASIRNLWLRSTQYAFKNELYMHEVLGLTALHIYRTDPSQKHRLITSVRHHEKALRQLRTECMNMTPENCEAVCLTSRLVIIYALGNYANSNPQEVPEWFGLLRGMYQVFNLATQMKDGVSEMFKPYLESSMVMIALEDLPVLQGEDFPGLAPFGEDTPLLDGSHDSDATDAEAISAYQTVIRILQLNINQTKTLCEAGTEPQAVFCWPIHVPQTFVDYLTERRPRALVIMAYFCTLWKRMEHLWWAKGNAEYELAKVKRMLSPEWHPYLEWPSSQIFDDPNMPVALQSPMPEIFETMSSTASDAAEESSSEPYWTYLGSSVGKQR